METTSGNRQIHSQIRGRLFPAVSRRTTAAGGSGTLTGIANTSGLNGHLTAHSAGDANDLGLHDLTRHTMRLCDHLRFTNLAAGRVRNLAGANLLRHRASDVGNLLCDGFAGPRAGRIRNLLRDGFAGPRAGRVRNFLRDCFTGPRASRVRDSLRDALLFVADTGVRNLFHDALGNLTTDRIGLLAVTNFLFHASTGDRSHFRPRHPTLAANRASRLATSGA